MDGSLLLGWAFGGFVVLLFGWRKFHEQHPDMKPVDRDRVLAEVYYHNLAVHRTFSKALAIYLSTLLFGYATVVVVGKPLIGINTDKIVGAAWPAFCGLLVAGLAPNVPWLSTLELWIRGMLHNRAMVLRYVDEIREELTIAQPRLEGLTEIDRRRLSLPKELTKAANFDSLEPTIATWSGAALLYNAFEHNSRTARIRNRVANAFYQRFKVIWERIRQDFFNLQPQMEQKAEETLEQYQARIRTLSQNVMNFSDDVYSFIGCAVANRSSKMSMRQAFANLKLEFSPTQQAEYRIERESQQQADMLVFSYFAALAAVGTVSVCLALINYVFGISPRPGWTELPALGSLGANLFSLFSEYGVLGLGLFLIFIHRRRRIEDNEWFQSTESDRDTRRISGGSYIGAGVILFGFFLCALMTLDIIEALGSDKRCYAGLTQECRDFLYMRLAAFPSRNWLRLVYGVVACLLIIGLLDKLNRSEAQSRQVRRLAVVVAAAAAMDFLGKMNLAIAALKAAQAGADEGQLGFDNLNNIDNGYIVLIACSALTFWGVFGARMLSRMRWSIVRDVAIESPPKAMLDEAAAMAQDAASVAVEPVATESSGRSRRSA